MDPLGVICLQGYTASCVPETAQDEPFAFRLVKFGSEVKYFAAKDKDTVNQWINCINQLANKLNQVLKRIFLFEIYNNFSLMNKFTKFYSIIV